MPVVAWYWLNQLSKPVIALPPLLVTMLNTAPCMLPYSAGAPTPTNSIVATMSVLGYGHICPAVGDVMFVPSIWYWFSFVFDPNAEEVVESCTWVEEIPGVIWK